VEEAAEFFKNTEGNIFITTGSKELEKYTVIPDYKNRCFARVLPTLSVMKSCHRLGFEGRNLIGMQGPFSEEMNIAMLRQCNASFLVTKQSGQQGGYREKCEAAIREGVSLVIVGVPTGSTEGIELDEAINILDGKINCEADSINQKSQLNQNSNEKNVPEKELEKELGKELGKETENEPQKELQHVSRKIYLIGMGPGNPQNCTYEAEECLKKADVIIGAGRVLDICDSLNKKIAEKPHLAEYKPDKVYEFLTVDEAGKKYQNIAIVFSGDIGYYSGAEKMAEYFLNENKKSKAAYWDIVRISGLSSPLYFLDKIGISWGNVKLLSRHAQQCNVTEMLKKYGKICVLLGKSTDVSDICRELILAGYDTMSVKMSTETHTEYKSKVHEQQGSVKLCVGERLSYKNERIVWGTPSDLIDMEFNPLSVLYISCS
jgi:precorrin-6B methylase 1